MVGHRIRFTLGNNGIKLGFYTKLTFQIWLVVLLMTSFKHSKNNVRCSRQVELQHMSSLMYNSTPCPSFLMTLKCLLGQCTFANKKTCLILWERLSYVGPLGQPLLACI